MDNLCEILVLTSYIIGSMGFAYYLNMINKKKKKEFNKKIDMIDIEFDLSTLDIERGLSYKQYWDYKNQGDIENAELMLKRLVYLDEKYYNLKKQLNQNN